MWVQTQNPYGGKREATSLLIDADTKVTVAEIGECEYELRSVYFKGATRCHIDAEDMAAAQKAAEKKLRDGLLFGIGKHAETIQYYQQMLAGLMGG